MFFIIYFVSQTLPLVQYLRIRKASDSINLPLVTITVEESDPIGSCCDNGRVKFRNCGNHWFLCPHWGLVNHTKWIQFGESGLKMPISTAHQATCHPTPTKTLCPLPPNCAIRIPPKWPNWTSEKEFETAYRSFKRLSNTTIYPSGLCGKIPIVRTEGIIYD